MQLSVWVGILLELAQGWHAWPPWQGRILIWIPQGVALGYEF